MTPVPVLDRPAVADVREGAIPVAHSARGRVRVALIQTQAEAAGAQEISRILGCGLEARGYDVHHIFFFRRTPAFDDQPNTFFCASQRPAGVASVVRMGIGLVRHLRALQPDAVLCFQHYGNIVGAAAARLAGIEAIIANRTSAKSLVPRWADGIDQLLGSTGLLKRVVVNSKDVEEEYRGHSAGYRSRLRRIDHGFAVKSTHLSRDDARRLLGLPAHVPLLGSVARLHPGKNLTAAVQLLAHGGDWHLALAGQGAERKHLAGLAESLGVSARLHFVGELTADAIGVFLRALDVFVFPTLAETFGLAAVEAAQAGVPVVANDIPVLREVLAVDGKPCALFVKADDAEAFAAAVRRVIADRELGAALAARGRRLSQRYSLDAMVQQYAALIDDLLAQSRNGSRP
jgi:glycosyltransferase involved in cell wall biosynthesis